MLALGCAWFGDRLRPEYRPRTLAEAQAVLAALGLTGEFWDLADG
jgi:hypothetical protein